MSTNSTDYMREYRARNADYVKRQRKVNKARRQALEATAKTHQSTFLQYYAHFRKQEGVAE